MRFDLVLFFILTLIAEIIGTLGGFGSSIFFVSISQFFFSFNTVLALTGALHIFSNISKLVLFRKTIDYKIFLWLGISSVVLAIVGALLTSFFSFAYSKFILSFFLIGISLFLFFNPAFVLKANKTNSVVSGALAGFLAGFIGTGGAIRGLALASFNLEKNFFVGTSAAIDFGVDLSRTIIYLENDFLKKEYFSFIPILILAAWFGSYIGKRLLSKINQGNFQRIVLILIFLIGVLMLVQEVRTFL